ncbi:MAG: hypothetical protein H7326_07375 [Bdellovibrionaceae bacterium]|nr:hypothetical protein [Pseudobdellovibrionaceae bacterium]
MKIYIDMGLLDEAIRQLQFADPFTKKTANAPFNRKYVLKSFAQLFETKFEDPDVEGKMATIEKNFDSNLVTEEDILGQTKNPMPMQQFLSAVHVDVNVWQSKIAPALVDFAAKLVRP